MDDSGLVSPAQPLSNLNGIVDRLLNGKRPARNLLIERLPLVIGHRDEELPILRFADFVDRRDVGVVEGGGGFRFANEALPGLGAGMRMGEQEFERDRAVELRVVSAVDDPHSSAAERFKNPVVRDVTSNEV